jgi:hypothetical protein
MILALALVAAMAIPAANAVDLIDDVEHTNRLACRLPAAGTPPMPDLAPVVCSLQPVSAAPADIENCCTRPNGATSPYAYSRRRECDADTMTAIRAANPDSLVVLGAGRLRSGGAHCDAVQRVHTAYQIFEAMRATQPDMPIVLSGANLTDQSEDLEEIDRRCVQARRGAATLPTGPLRLSEAEQMCGLLLRHYPRDRQDAVLAHIVFENQAGDTLQNAQYSVPLLQQRRARQPMIVTTNPRQPHDQRALGNFRTVAGANGMRFSTAVCPFNAGHGRVLR